ncbi:CotH kinase family protein [Desulfobacterales bacterium HSG2]|nr:CotH kinase family protein [Desulfobacterales bacterium HSG2]
MNRKLFRVIRKGVFQFGMVFLILAVLPSAICAQGQSPDVIKSVSPVGAKQGAGTQPSLCINEIMASNSSTLADPQGDYDDWIEIYNSGSEPVSLMGMYLTDDLAEPGKWGFPDITLNPGEFLLVWADEDIGDEGIHADFKLGASGEAVGLFDSDQTAVDTLTFEAQTEDVSFGRYPDGSDNWKFFSLPTPGQANKDTLLSGDIDGNGIMNLADIILSVQVCAGLPIILRGADVTGDGKIGLEEAIYIIRKLSESAGEPDEERSEGWSDETHGDSAAPNYDAVFSGDTVRQIELIIDPADWQAMMEDMTDKYGEFGAGDTNQPSPGATDACIGLNEGDPCEMEFKGQSISGSCMTEMGQLACMPDNAGGEVPGESGEPGSDDNQPPPEATDACIGLNEGDPCEMMFKGQSTSGSCVTEMGELACMPGNAGGEVPGEFVDPASDTNQPSPEATDACIGLNEGDPCEMMFKGQSTSGSCVTEMGELACMPDNAGGEVPGERPDNEMTLTTLDPIWKPCTLKFEGKAWNYVGVRIKGHSSLSGSWRSGVWKFPLRLDFDQFEDDYPEIENQRFHGFKKLSLSSNYKDDSLIREKVAADIFRDAGVPAPKTAFYRVYVNHGNGSEYFGLYTMVEIPDDPMLDEYFQNSDGNLYKPEGQGATFATFDEASFDKKTNEDEADWSDVRALFDTLQSSGENAALWRSSLENVLNVDGFLRWLAVNTLIQNWDTYGLMSHNYYLYTHPEDERIHWIPWDNNESLSEQDQGAHLPLSLSLDEVGSGWPLIRYLADDAVYWQKYVSFVKEATEGAFDPEKMKAEYKAAHDLIRPYVVGDEGETEGHTFLSTPEDFDTALEYLNTHVESRQTDALQFVSDNQ